MHRRKVRDKNKKSQSKLPFKFNKNNKSSKKYPNNSHKQIKDPKRKKLTNDDDCPIHGWHHKWAQCHQNQYGDNFALGKLEDLKLPMLLNSPHTNHPSIMDFNLKFTSISKKIDSLKRTLMQLIRANSVAKCPPDIQPPTLNHLIQAIEIQIMDIVNSCQ